MERAAGLSDNSLMAIPRRTRRSEITRLDRVLFLLGPGCLLLIWWMLPAPVDEGARDEAADPVTGVIAELVGYSLTLPEDGCPRVLGSGPQADFRLYNAPISARAAILYPPRPQRPSPLLTPAGIGVTLRLTPRREATAAAAAARRVTETSLYPWRGRDPGPLSLGCDPGSPTLVPERIQRLEVRPPSAGAGPTTEPQILWLDSAAQELRAVADAGVEILSCPPGGGVRWAPLGTADSRPAAELCAQQGSAWEEVGVCWGIGDDICRSYPADWAVRVDRGAPASPAVVWPWTRGLSAGDSWIAMYGREPRNVRLGLDDSTAGGQVCSPAVRDAETPPPEDLRLCSADGEPRVIGPLELRHGDLLRIGRTRFLVELPEPPEGGRPELRLLHVRDPRRPHYFRASSGAEVYHPNRRALWNVPFSDLGGAELRLSVTRSTDRELAAAEALPELEGLAVGDRDLQRQIAAAAANEGVPHLLPAVSPDGRQRAVAVGARRAASGELEVRLRTGAPNVTVQSSPAERSLLSPDREEVFALGDRGQPEELLLDLGGNLIRLAPAAGARVGRHTRRGLAGYLILLLLLQAVPLTLARIAFRRRGERPTTAPAADPRLARRAQALPATELTSAILQQVSGVAVACLLFTGGCYQLFLALHPQLAGKPDYHQAFLQGVVFAGTILAAAAGFALGHRLPQRLASAVLWAGLSALAGALWWWWDGLGTPGSLWLSGLRSSAAGAPGFGTLLLAAAGAAIVGWLILSLVQRLRAWELAADAARLAVLHPAAASVVLITGGLAVALVRRSALAFELGVLAAIAWYAGTLWAFVRHGRSPRAAAQRGQAALISNLLGLTVLAFLLCFFAVGSGLPDALSYALAAAGLAVLAVAYLELKLQKLSTLLRVVRLWVAATLIGAAFATLVVRDMGSVAAWMPAVLAGLFLWMVRPEEHEARFEESRRGRTQLLIAAGAGLILLGLLDIFAAVVERLPWSALERPRQRLELAEDVSYLTPGEWITQVRWLASGDTEAFRWVPNMNSDIAVFGIAANFGFWQAVVSSLLLLLVAASTALAAEQALRAGRQAAVGGDGDREAPALYRALGLLLGMSGVLLIAQWLVHLATGVVLHLPITGLVFPWISHGNTTHLLYTAVVLLPMAALTALGAQPSGGRG